MHVIGGVLVDLRQYFDFNINGILNLATAVLGTCIGMLVLLRDPRSSTHRSFFLLTVAGVGWLFSFAMMILVADERNAYLWLRVAYFFFIPYISPAVYLFSLYWTKRRITRGGLAALFGTAFLFGTVMLVWAPRICTFRLHSWGRLNDFSRSPASLAFIVPFGAFFFAFAFLAFKNIYTAWRAAKSPQQRTLFGYFLVAFTIGYLGSVDMLVAAGLLEFPRMGHICFLLFLLIIAIAIFRHQFLDVNLVLRKISLFVLIYSIMVALLLPVAIPTLRDFLNHPPENPIGFMLFFSFVLAAFLALGPWIYAAIIRRGFWLKSNSTAGLAHELKSPLSIIQGATEVMRTRMAAAADDPKAGEYLGIIEKNTSRLEALVNNLLLAAKISEGDITLKKGSVDLAHIAHSEADVFREAARGKGLSIQASCESSLLSEGEEEKLRLVFSNLLSNAVKFSSRGTVCVTARREENEIVCSVADEGCGIPRSDLQLIFERFTHGQNSTKGAGLGLAIAKAWVEAHGGRIWAESDGIGKGATFTFTLPAA